MMSALTRTMKERTGRSLEEWLELVRQSGIDPLDQKAVRNWLKREHRVPQNTRWAIADAAARAAGWERPSTDEYIEQQYQGAKAHLRPIFERLREVLLSLGDDVQMEGRATYIPFVRRRQFAAIEAPSRTRVVVGLRFTDPPDSPLLKPANGPGQATHQLSLSSPDEVTGEVVELLRAAYKQNG